MYASKGVATSLRSSQTILRRQSAWILWPPENFPHPGLAEFHTSLLLLLLLQVSYIFGDMSEYVLIKLKHD